MTTPRWSCRHWPTPAWPSRVCIAPKTRWRRWKAPRSSSSGGGNTFNLLGQLRRQGLLDVVARRVRAGAAYLGWSAGSNLTCPSICTTNDMPITDPEGFDALGLLSFQINPHYTNAHPPGHRGETRAQRLAEFCTLNPTMPVLGLPEGAALRVRGDKVSLIGPHDAPLFQGHAEPRVFRPGPLEIPA